MNIIISGRGVNVSEGTRAVIEKKLGKLEKYLPEDTPVNVVLQDRRGKVKTEVTIPLKKHILRAEELCEDLGAAADAIEDVLERQIRKYKTKILSKRRDSIKAYEAPVAEEPEEESGEIDIVRSKIVPVKPMSPDEACMQMDLLGHDFYMFRNDTTEEINVVYKRNDGAYGLLEPEA